MSHTHTFGQFKVTHNGDFSGEIDIYSWNGKEKIACLPYFLRSTRGSAES